MTLLLLWAALLVEVGGEADCTDSGAVTSALHEAGLAGAPVEVRVQVQLQEQDRLRLVVHMTTRTSEATRDAELTVAECADAAQLVALMVDGFLRELPAWSWTWAVRQPVRAPDRSSVDPPLPLRLELGGDVGLMSSLATVQPALRLRARARLGPGEVRTGGVLELGGDVWPSVEVGQGRARVWTLVGGGGVSTAWGTGNGRVVPHLVVLGGFLVGQGSELPGARTAVLPLVRAEAGVSFESASGAYLGLALGFGIVRPEVFQPAAAPSFVEPSVAASVFLGFGRPVSVR